MGFRGLLELSGITLHAPPGGPTYAPVACDLPLDVHSPDLLLDYDGVALLVDVGAPLPLDVHSPALLLDASVSEIVLLCPY